jgi:hypothetical protein
MSAIEIGIRVERERKKGRAALSVSILAQSFKLAFGSRSFPLATSQGELNSWPTREYERQVHHEQMRTAAGSILSEEKPSPSSQS